MVTCSTLVSQFHGSKKTSILYHFNKLVLFIIINFYSSLWNKLPQVVQEQDSGRVQGERKQRKPEKEEKDEIHGVVDTTAQRQRLVYVF